jgi:predicted nucleic acid-binding protein
MLDSLTAGDDRVTTTGVIAELRQGLRDHPELQDAIELPWLRVVSLDELDELRLFGEYTRQLGSGIHDIGEATVLAWAEARTAAAFTDDDVAVQVGRDRGVLVYRTLAVVARGVRREVLTEQNAEVLIDELLRAGGRFPCGTGEFIKWAQEEGLLTPAG